MKIPLDNVVCWPTGARLRFKRDADVQQKYECVRGTDVVVFSGPCLKSPADGNVDWVIRQRVLSYAICGCGWARPEQLEPRPDDVTPPSMVTVNRAEAPAVEDVVV